MVAWDKVGLRFFPLALPATLFGRAAAPHLMRSVRREKVWLNCQKIPIKTQQRMFQCDNNKPAASRADAYIGAALPLACFEQRDVSITQLESPHG